MFYKTDPRSKSSKANLLVVEHDIRKPDLVARDPDDGNVSEVGRIPSQQLIIPLLKKWLASFLAGSPYPAIFLPGLHSTFSYDIFFLVIDRFIKKSSKSSKFISIF